jgi:hypothetical protein
MRPFGRKLVVWKRVVTKEFAAWNEIIAKKERQQHKRKLIFSH